MNRDSAHAPGGDGEDTRDGTDAALDTNQIIAERREKLKALRASGNAYPNDFVRHDLAADVTQKYGSADRDSLQSAAAAATVAGRIMLKRVMGKASFATIRDMSGEIQIYVTDGDTGRAEHEAFKHWDLGDFVGVEGALFKTKTGELTVRARKVHLLSKALRPLPDKFHGLADQELRYRQRYVDLIINDETRETFLKRTRIIQALREFFVKRGYLEVETPMMQPIPGGAAARPFVTHHNALDIDLYLRIAPELYLKRLVVGGFEKVFELNRNFRNEGISTRHNPEFTMVEFYTAYTDYRYLMDFIEQLLGEVAQQAVGTKTVTYQGKSIDLSRPYDRLTITGAIRKYHPEYDGALLGDRDALVSRLKALGASYKPSDGLGGLQLSFFEHTTEQLLIQPTYILDYPAEVSPLARRSDTDPEITERFELYIAGREIANGFSELNDPEDQAARFMDQVRQKEAGDAEAMHYDADYIRALEYGLPPTAGAGIGVDRLVMLLTDSSSIRDVILFPHMRPEQP
ncbi:MAG TPA: lysine--tRNA ligase [Burkholderiales bacterium]|nr:lysine--tRNA ligase [Burkholderiales bacterium]